MKRFGNLIWIVIISATGCLVVAYLIDNVIELKGLSLSTLSSVVAIFTSVIVFASGIVIYQKFNGSQALVDKQTEKTIELLTFLNTLTISVDVNSSDLQKSIYNLHVVDYKERRASFIGSKIDVRTFKNVFNYRMFGMTQKLVEFAGDPYLPKSIAATISMHIEYNSASVLVPPKDKLFVVDVQGQFVANPPESIDDDGSIYRDFVSLYETVDGKEFSLEELMYKLEVIYGASFKWLNQNNPTISNTLNIRPVEVFDRKKDML